MCFGSFQAWGQSLSSPEMNPAMTQLDLSGNVHALGVAADVSLSETCTITRGFIREKQEVGVDYQSRSLLNSGHD